MSSPARKIKSTETEQILTFPKKQREPKKFGLVWEQKTEQVIEDCKRKLPVLKETTTKAVVTDKNQPTNLIIEGDNYHALSALNYTHEGKIDVIYIDPPFNTGNKSWRYNNQYVEKDDSFRHSKWLSFLSKRIQLAKKLLSKRGILIVAIDDYELFYLGSMLDECLGESNRLGVITVQHNPGGRSDDHFFATSHEYLLVYAKNVKYCQVHKFSLTPDEKSEYKFQDNISKYKLLNFRRTGSNSTPDKRPNLFYPIYYNEKTNKISLEKKNNFCAIYPIDKYGDKRVWRWGKPSLQKVIDTGLVINKKNDKYIVKLKQRLKENIGKRAKTVWISSKYNASTYGTLLLKEILDKNVDFPYPKSIHAVKDIINLCTPSKNSIILDFFAGSGTTGQAVLEINKEDGGNRQFILCTNNENNICEEVTYPRIKNVIKGYKFKGIERKTLFDEKVNINLFKNAQDFIEKINTCKLKHKEQYDSFKAEIDNKVFKLVGIKNIDDKKEGLGGNLRYFKTDFVNYNSYITDSLKMKITKNATELLCIKENAFEKITDNKGFKIFKSNKYYVGIIFKDNYLHKFKEEIKKIDKSTSIYVFSLFGEGAFEKQFNNIKNVKVIPVPEAILKVYMKIFFKSRDIAYAA